MTVSTVRTTLENKIKKNEPKKYTRRQFIRLSGIVGVGAFIAGGSYLLRMKMKVEQCIIFSHITMTTFVGRSM
ncbi:MAG: hypothetical protein K8S87_05975, partial [Planctomycetes bacterium]|nr:hypothetical protein [Planctomycetota bacterium]